LSFTASDIRLTAQKIKTIPTIPPIFNIKWYPTVIIVGIGIIRSIHNAKPETTSKTTEPKIPSIFAIDSDAMLIPHPRSNISLFSQKFFDSKSPYSALKNGCRQKTVNAKAMTDKGTIAADTVR
jgi:hypothetical protein